MQLGGAFCKGKAITCRLRDVEPQTKKKSFTLGQIICIVKLHTSKWGMDGYHWKNAIYFAF